MGDLLEDGGDAALADLAAVVLLPMIRALYAGLVRLGVATVAPAVPGPEGRR